MCHYFCLLEGCHFSRFLPPTNLTEIFTYPVFCDSSCTCAYAFSVNRGDDDINDVAAMGGVNLAEESQRILGSTEFVGTQIRSCKDEVFLHMTPLQQRIKQIGNFHINLLK